MISGSFQILFHYIRKNVRNEILSLLNLEFLLLQTSKNSQEEAENQIKIVGYCPIVIWTNIWSTKAMYWKFQASTILHDIQNEIAYNASEG